MKLTLHVWRQKDAQTQGKMVDYTLDNVSEDMS
ncbi:MAG: succinate dehydrogenase/fumarate reductase iron-sulfur subunit, partial [Bacteroidota bacterium]|nr:succinate dehydrogenase/fumarate reductase iron-sulfur subunit [Bacteroidota bacterium]